MFERITLNGFYKDEQIRMDFMQENPLKYGLAENLIWFAPDPTSFGNNKNKLDISEFHFYIIGKDIKVCNEAAQEEVECEMFNDDNCSLGFGKKTLIGFEFKAEFLYYKTYIGFHRKHYDKIVFVLIER